MVGILEKLKLDVEKALEEERKRKEAEELAYENAIAAVIEQIRKGTEDALANTEVSEKIRWSQGKKDYLLIKIIISGAPKHSCMIEAMKRLEAEENSSCDDMEIKLETDSGNVNVRLYKKKVKEVD